MEVIPTAGEVTGEATGEVAGEVIGMHNALRYMSLGRVEQFLLESLVAYRMVSFAGLWRSYPDGLGKYAKLREVKAINKGNHA